MLIGIKKNITIEEEREEKKEGRIVCRERVGGKIQRIMGTYINGDMDRQLEGLMGWIEKGKEEIKTLIGGDFNARIGEKGGWMREKELERAEKGRRSKDRKMNGDERKLIKCIERRE